VRAYAKLLKISPPTASKILKSFAKKGILSYSQQKGYNCYVAHKTELFAKLQQTYWYLRLEKEGLLKQLQTQYFNNPIVLFGSLAKAEATLESDIDLAIIGSVQKCDLSAFEKLFNRKIQVLTFESVAKLPKNLRNSILNGYVLSKGMFYGLE
jgi:predicted nucleotidyltransferase